METLLLSGGNACGFHNFCTRSSPISPLNPNTQKIKNYKCCCKLSSPTTTVQEFDQNSLHISSPSTSNNKNRAQKTAVSSSTSYSERKSTIVQVQNAPNLESALSRYGAILKVQDLNAIMRYFGNSYRWEDVSELFAWMEKHGKLNIGSYSSFIKFMGKGRNPIKALEAYNSIQDETTRINVSVCNSILGCLIRNGKSKSSFELFDQMKQSGLLPDAVTYSTLLSGCMKGKDGYSKAIQLVQEMNHNGLKMDTVIYGSLLAICASNNRCEDAEAYFQQMKNEGYSPNEFHYSSLLNAYSVEGNHSKADALVKDMKSAGLVPNKVSLTTLLKVYVRGGLFEKARVLLGELETLGYAQDEMPYCLLMDALAKAGHIDEAKSVFNEIEARGVKSDGYCHSIMISAFCRSRRMEEAKQLAREFEARYEKYDLVMLNTLLRAYCEGGEMESVMHLLRKMDELSISPDNNTFHILIKYFCKEKLYQLAYKTMVDMDSKGYHPNEELGSALIQNLGKVGAAAEAFAVYNILRYSKRALCRALHGRILNILISGGLLKDAYVVVKDNAEQISRSSLKKFALSFMKSGNVNLINDVVKVLHNSGYKIDQEVCGMAISRYIGEPEKKQLLVQLLQWMSGQGYVVDSASRNLILKNSHLFGRHLISDILAKQHKMSKELKIQT
ncbi:hypothetical protein C5167_013347 [Papaver somniferum]|uniref:PROP1-like PPR domain-containing protein n=1 Tax=Papaver somniferum TaxID=3469 RepID=A0A4Y7J354_PAPSO|nr:hypothetical protein C5167_013347 [Papaver somniferum]